MKKVFFLIVLCLLLSGCKAEVNISVTEDMIVENTKVYDLKENVYDVNNNIKEDINFYITIFEREYEFYDINVFEEDSIIGKTYDYEVPLNIWHEASRLRSCYDSVKINKNMYFLSIETSDEYRCGYLYGATDVVINITSDLKLKESNADEVIDNKHIWRINESNYKNKKISIVYDIKKENFDKQNSEMENNSQLKNKKQSKIIYYVLITLAFIIMISVIYVFVKVNKSNK